MQKILSISVLIIVSVSLFAQDKVQWRGDNRDGKFNDTGLLKEWPENGPELLWHFDELGDGHASATVTSKSIYTAGMLDGLGYVFALDLDGKLLWKSEIGKSWDDNWNGVRSTPLYFDNKLYIMSAFGKLVCMNADDGKYIWDIDLFKQFNGRNIKWGVTENLLIDDNKLFIILGGAENNVIALNPLTGQLIWSCEGNGEKSSYNSPVVFTHNGRKIFAAQTESSILGIDASTGKLLWRVEHINEWSVHPNIPLYENGFLYVVSGYGKGGVKLKISDDGNSISKVWSDENLDNQMGGVVLLDGKLYGAGHNNRKYFCIDWETGEEVYSTRTFQRGNTITAEGLIYFYDERGKVGLIKPEESGFKELGVFEVPYGENQHWAHLVIAGKRLYVRHGTSLMVYSIAQ